MSRDEGIYSATYADGTRVRVGDTVRTPSGRRWRITAVTFYETGGPAACLQGLAEFQSELTELVANLTYDSDPLTVQVDHRHAERILAWVAEHIGPERDDFDAVWLPEVDEAERAAMRHLADAITAATAG